MNGARMAFVVTEMGVYLQGVFGPFDTELAAKTFAQEKATNDVDDYHEWCVQSLTLDSLGEPVASYRKFNPAPRYFMKNMVEEAKREDRNRDRRQQRAAK